MASSIINTLTSFSGSDLMVSFANQTIGELQQIAWSIEREKNPVFTLGSADARSFSRGKRGIAGTMVFSVFDHDSLTSAMQRVWDKLAPPAMFTPAGNLALAGNENFLEALDMIKWNKKAQNAIAESHPGDFGYSGTSAIISKNNYPGSNNTPQFSQNGEITGWTDSTTDIRVPAGFSPIRGQNIVYSDTLPPFDATLTFGNEYGQCAFQKIYDIDILNESSGVSVDTNVLENQKTYIARRISPMTKGVYQRDDKGNVKGMPVVSN